MKSNIIELCKYQPANIGTGSSSEWEYGVAVMDNPNKRLRLHGPGAGGFWVNTDRKDNGIVLLGDVKLLENIDKTVKTHFEKLIKSLEFPPIESIMSIIPEEDNIDMNILNSQMNDEELLTKISFNEIRQQLIKHMLFANYAKAIFESALNNETIVLEEEVVPLVNQKLNKIDEIHEIIAKKADLRAENQYRSAWFSAQDAIVSSSISGEQFFAAPSIKDL